MVLNRAASPGRLYTYESGFFMRTRFFSLVPAGECLLVLCVVSILVLRVEKIFPGFMGMFRRYFSNTSGL